MRTHDFLKRTLHACTSAGAGDGCFSLSVHRFSVLLLQRVTWKQRLKQGWG